MFTASTYSFENTGSSTISASGIAVTVGALTATTGAFSDDVIITSASATPLTIARSGGAATSMIMRTGASKYAWQMAAQFYTDAGLDFVPSTAVGGTTFTTPVFGLTQAGPATFYGNAVAMGALTATTVTVGSTPLVIQEYGLERSSNLANLEVAINYEGFGISHYRNFTVYDGKHYVLFSILGSSGAASFGSNAVSMGALTATTGTFSGLLTAQAGLTVSGGSISAPGIATTVGALTATLVTVGGTPLVVQEYGLERSSNLDDLEVAINYDGYGATRFRNFSVYDGKHNLLFRITGSTSAASFQNNSVSMGALTATTVTGTGLFLTPASASGGAGLRLPHGAAPSSPTDGDIWTTTAGLYVRINGGTVGPLT